MAKKRRQDDEEAWKNAKTMCRLNTRQVEMARALGISPGKLPTLRPSPHERWKLPVGAFIEECYRKRFGAHPEDNERADPQRRPLPGSSNAYGAQAVCDATSQAEELICYLVNLADDLRKWLAHGTVTDVLPEVSEELRCIAKALDSGAWISAIPEIALPPRSPRGASSRGRSHERPWDDEDDIPF
jgi:hypothetical protein